MRLCTQCGYEGEAVQCPHDGTRTVDMSAYRRGDDEAPDLVGTVIAGRYRIDSLLGHGAMGWVFRGTQLGMERQVALKIMRNSGNVTATWVRRFAAEARSLSKLHQPHTVRVFDFGPTDEGLLYIAMELLHGRPLSHELDAVQRFSQARAAHVGRQICLALQEAHELELVHRDLKPDNVFVVEVAGQRDFVKVLDFGIAKAFGSEGNDARLTHTGMLIGTPRYMSPEQCAEEPVGPASDLYSLGVILYELVTGHPPFAAESTMAQLMAHINEAPPPVDTVVDDLDPAFAALVMRLLSKSPDDRPASAQAVALALAPLAAQWLAGAEARSRAPTSATPSDGAEALVAPLAATLSSAPKPAMAAIASSDTVAAPSPASSPPAADDSDDAPVSVEPEPDAAGNARRGLLLGIASAAVALIATLVIAFSSGTGPNGEGTSSAAMVPSAAEDGRPTLTMVWLPTADPEAQLEEIRWFLAILEEETGHRIVPMTTSTYDETIGKVLRDEIDLGIMSPNTYVLAKRRDPELVLLSRILYEGTSAYQAVVLAAATSSVHALADARGASFCFVDPASTSGYVYPRVMLKKAGVDPVKDLGRVLFAGRHQTALDWLVEGRCELTSVSSSEMGRWMKRTQTLTGKVRILASSPPIPSNAVFMRHDLSADVAAGIQRAMGRLMGADAKTSGRAKPSPGQASSFITGFAKATDRDYDVVREAAAELLSVRALEKR